MTLALITSFIAFGSYGSLLVLLFRSGPMDGTRRLFFLYLLDMLLLQSTYLMVSLARREQLALFGYMLNAPLSLGQVSISFFFSRAFLGKKTSRTLWQTSLLLWVLVVIVCFSFRPYLIPQIYRDPTSGLFLPEIGAFAAVLAVPVLLLLACTVFELVRGYRKSLPLQRIRIQYLTLAILVVWVGMFANSWPVLRRYPIDVAANIASAILIALAILRYQLLDINIVIRKGVVYSVSVLIMGMGYFLVVFLLTQLFIAEASNTLILSIIAAVIVVGVLTPLRDRAQLLIDRALFRDKYDGTTMIQRLSHTTASILDLERLSHVILDDVVNTMHIQWAVLSVKREQDFQPLAIKGLDVEYRCLLDHSHPVLQNFTHTPGIVTREHLCEMQAQGRLSQQQFNELSSYDIEMIIPLKTRESLVGVLVLGPKLSQQLYSPDDHMILATLANQVAVAMDNARLYAALQKQLVEREQLIVKLQSTNAELESFTYTVSHDLKAPLITINGFLNFLQNDVMAGKVEHVNADILRITEATAKMHRLLNELLDLSRIGRMMDDPEDVSFAELVNNAVNNVRGRLNAGQVTVRVQPGSTSVRGDRRRLTAVLQNLIDNAAKYMGDQPEPYIEIGQHGLDLQSGQAIFYVRDNGIGIAPEHYNRIFGLFSKLDPKSDGTGVGLSLVRKIIETHGGRIWLESEVGKGAVFYFTLPVS